MADDLPLLAPDAPSRPVVLELFTSQGCSSCPPADRLLHRLGDELGDAVYPLAFHVDYWNYIGWTDPFSSAEWSKRQEDYARVLEGGRLYTPQLVIDGRAHVTGSNGPVARRHFDDARRRAALGKVEISGQFLPDRLRLDLGAVGDGAIDAEKLDLVVALYERELTTPVRRGENGGRTLDNDFVVRRLEVAARLAADAAQPSAARLEFSLEPSWRRDKLGVVAFLQDPKTLRIYGAVRWMVPATD